MKKQIKLWSLSLFAITAVWGQESKQQNQNEVVDLEEVVISDSRFALKRENSGKTVISITKEDLEKQQGNSLATIINNYSGIEINGSRSNAGQNLSYFIRGGNNRQVLIMVDGIQMNDPSQIAGDYDLRLIDVSQVESVEIIKGAASTLYGNAAATAVIRISTKQGAKEKIAATLASTAGTNQSSSDQNYGIREFTNSAFVNGTLSALDYAVSLGHTYTDGLSAVEGSERDPFRRFNTGVRLGYKISDAFRVKAGVSYDDLRSEFDNSFPLEDADYVSESEQTRVTLSPEYTYQNGGVYLNAAWYAIERVLESAFPAVYEAENFVVDVYNKYVFNDRFYTIVGLNHISSKADVGGGGLESFSINDPYANVVYISEYGFQLNTGVRWNNHSTYGSNLTYSMNPSYVIKFKDDYLKFMGSYSSSFIAPTITQLYGPFGANPELEPEENVTVEGGAEYRTQNLRISGLYFNRLEENFIDYRTVNFETFEGEFYNVSETFRVEGVELEFNATLSESLSVNGNYTFTQNRDRAALRIPKHKVNTAINYALGAATNLDLGYQYTGSRMDTNFTTFENETLDAFNIFNLGLSHEFSKTFRGSLRFNNLLNESYTEIIGYPTRGRNIAASVRITL